MSSRIKKIVFIALIVLIILNFYYLRSLLIMYPYNKINYYKSFVKEENVLIDIPKEEELEWYPIMNFYNSENFGKYINADVDLGIYYTFGKFRGKQSDIFRKESETYSSFYGAYVLKNNENAEYILSEKGDLIVDDIIDILVYDYEYLVIRPLGYDKALDIDYNLMNVENNKIFTELNINGLSHNYKSFNTNYLQYGIEGSDEEIEFEKIKTYGKFIVDNPQDSIYIIYYIINNNKNIVENWGI